MNDLADRRLEEKERRRADILDAAEQIAAKVGVEQMTMDEVARRARLSRALLYVYFQDKSDLLFALCERALQMLHERFSVAASQHSRGLAQLEACGRAYLDFAVQQPVYFDALSRFQAHESQPGNFGNNEGACMLAGDKVHGVMFASIERGIADGSLRKDVGPPALVAMTLWGFMHGIIQLQSTKGAVLAHNGIDGGVLAAHALQLAMHGIAQH